jgi:hypothetical protein
MCTASVLYQLSQQTSRKAAENNQFDFCSWVCAWGDASTKEWVQNSRRWADGRHIDKP